MLQKHKNALDSFAELMDEAADAISQIPDDVIRTHKIRYHLGDELNGSAMICRDADYWDNIDSLPAGESDASAIWFIQRVHCSALKQGLVTGSPEWASHMYEYVFHKIKRD